jgi:hypothetical protein
MLLRRLTCLMMVMLFHGGSNVGDDGELHLSSQSMLNGKEVA